MRAKAKELMSERRKATAIMDFMVKRLELANDEPKLEAQAGEVW